MTKGGRIAEVAGRKTLAADVAKSHLLDSSRDIAVAPHRIPT
jgi:hypothetical protein